jgi:aspartyl-tRNA synthetase
MHRYRTHTCNELSVESVGQTVRLSGWIHRKRDHGNLVFVDLRDNYGITQVLCSSGNEVFDRIQELSLESVITVTGVVVKRGPETVNPSLPTGEIEVQIRELGVQSVADQLPFPVNSDHPAPEDLRLRYRFVDLRRKRPHDLVHLRSRIVSRMREKMNRIGFTEITTPILTATSPEGARDFLVPSRLHPGKFYALPQAPQIFKQLLMVAGFDRYFQIAPCFRDEAARADRSPGEFYQLDLEMSFVEQEDILSTVEPVLYETFAENSDWAVTPMPWPRIPYNESMLKYGSDKPDLRIPIEISDVTEIFAGSDFELFAKAVAAGQIVRAIPVKGAASQPRSFFDKMNEWARGEGMGGLGYIQFDGADAKGPIAKRIDAGRLGRIREACGLSSGDAVFFVCAARRAAPKLAGAVRLKLADELDLREKGVFKMCWVVAFPMYEWDEERQQHDFSHNPFSMPTGGLEALNTMDPLDIEAYQYDIVVNGMEIGSGAIRNHHPETLLKAFEIAGYSPEETERIFGGMLRAFRMGAPPHGGMAPGIDRIVMLIADLPNIREGVTFPMNQQLEDLMLGAPSTPGEAHLKELHIRPVLPPVKKKD